MFLALLRFMFLVFALGLSWNQFILIFELETSTAQLLVTTSVASSIAISSMGLAYYLHGPLIGSVVFALALLIAALLKVYHMTSPSITWISAIYFFAYLATMG